MHIIPNVYIIHCGINMPWSSHTFPWLLTLFELHQLSKFSFILHLAFHFVQPIWFLYLKN